MTARPHQPLQRTNLVSIRVLDDALAFIRRLANQPAQQPEGYGRTTEQIKQDAQRFLNAHGLT